MSQAIGIIRAPARREIPARAASERAFLGVAALIFAASVTATVSCCASMSAMDDILMPGGGAMSMAWPPTCGRTWPAAAASFLGMWVAMMVAMMLPSLVPALGRYRAAVGRRGETRLGLLTALVGLGYFSVWAAFGMALFPLSAALSAVEMRLPAMARAVPIAIGFVVVAAGALQFTAWRMHHLACFREEPRSSPGEFGAAWRYGVRLGLHCNYCCGGLTAILLVVGMTGLRVMAVVTVAVTAERLAPACMPVARAIGAVTIGAGFWLIAQAAGLG